MRNNTDLFLFGRRGFLTGVGATLLAVATRPVPTFAASSVGEYPFTIGVASGEPASDGFVLWTRLAPKPFEPGGGMPQRPVAVRWQIALDEHMRKVVQTGTAVAFPQLAHSVHVEVHGLLPSRWYWYRFESDGELSAVGRARTAPALGAPVRSSRSASSPARAT